MSSLQNLLSPIKIKTMELSNRVVLPPMGTNLETQMARSAKRILPI